MDPYDFSFIEGFIGEMIKFITNREAKRDDEKQTLELAECVAAVLSSSSAPAKISAAVDTLEKSDHWIASALALDKGKRIIQVALESAERRSGQNEILEKINNNIEQIEAVNALDLETYVTCIEKFTPEYGRMFLGSSLSVFVSLS